MSILNSVLKLFVGDKSKQDVKAILPLVEKVKSFEKQLEELSHDALRSKTDTFKHKIEKARATFEDQIITLQDEADSIEDIDRKEDIYSEIDQLKDASYAATETLLNTLLPEAFAVVKETAKRFVDNQIITVTASTYDRELSGTKTYVTLDNDKAMWSNSWDAAGKPITWDMIHYDVQIIGGIAMHEGKISEMQTGEGKTLTAVMPAYLNAIGGEGVHIVTVNEYLASREAEGEIGDLFRWLGLTVGLNKRELTKQEKKETKIRSKS